MDSIRGPPVLKIGTFFYCTGCIMFGRWVAVLLLVGALFSLAGCNTVAGLGQDVTSSARTVQHAL
jgi:predicted small secreted protein